MYIIIHIISRELKPPIPFLETNNWKTTFDDVLRQLWAVHLS